MVNIVNIPDYDYICTYCAAAIPSPESFACRPCMRMCRRLSESDEDPCQSVDFACMLGLFPSRPDAMYPPYTHDSQELVTEEMKVTLEYTEDPVYARLLFSRFCAIYFPVLSDAIHTSDLPPPHVRTPRGEPWFERCMTMLACCCENRFFSKFFTSRKEAASGKEALVVAIAERMLKGEASHDDESRARNCRVLYNCLALLKRTQFDKHDALVALLEQWLAASQSREYIERLRKLLVQDEQEVKRAKEHAEQLVGLTVCSRDGCTNTEGLKACSRCKTVAYCCPEHQAADWSNDPSSHKGVCYKTTF